MKGQKTFTGSVISNKMNKTVVVSVERLEKDPYYGKYLKKRVKYMAHDEKGESKAGDRVSIVECRPLSKMKRWYVKEILEKRK